MLYILIFVLLGIIIYFVFFGKIKVKFFTFLQKGFKKKNDNYGVYCYCGKQGKGKTYSLVEFLLNNKNVPIYANISSIKGVNYTYFSGLDNLLKLRDKKDCIIVYDEIFTALTKSTKMTTDILDFLSQMRKRRIIFITTAQEWLEINITLRRYCRYQIECNMFSIGNYPILIKSMFDAEKMKWDNLENEYVAPLCDITISHGIKKVVDSYDTYEQIKKISNSCEEITSPQEVMTNESIDHSVATTTISNTVVSGQESPIDTQFWDDLIDNEVLYDKE